MVNNSLILLGETYLHYTILHNGSDNQVPIQGDRDKTRSQVQWDGQQNSSRTVREGKSRKSYVLAEPGLKSASSCFCNITAVGSRPEGEPVGLSFHISELGTVIVFHS